MSIGAFEVHAIFRGARPGELMTNDAFAVRILATRSPTVPHAAAKIVGTVNVAAGVAGETGVELVAAPVGAPPRTIAVGGVSVRAAYSNAVTSTSTNTTAASTRQYISVRHGGASVTSDEQARYHEDSEPAEQKLN